MSFFLYTWFKKAIAITIPDKITVILAQFFLFSQTLQVSIAARYALTFCYLKANLVSIYYWVNTKKGIFQTVYKENIVMPKLTS